jgi:hypothetical protein
MKTLRSWFLMTEYELLMNTLSVLVATILLVLKMDFPSMKLTWSHVFMPLFIVDGLQVYFLIMVVFRFYYENTVKAIVIRLLLNLIVLILKFLFKFLLYLKATHVVSIKYAFISLPIFLICIFLLFKTCSLNRNFDVIK